MLADELKRRTQGLILLGGGPDCLDYTAERYLEHFDYLIEKEGELAICQFVEEVQHEGRVSSTKGVWYRDEGGVKLTAPAERIPDLDRIPYPDFSDFDVRRYKEGLPVLFSRGCNANCVFCTNKKYFSHQISRSGENMCLEVEAHIRKTVFPRSRRSFLLERPNRFIFSDDSLLSATNLEEFMGFCDRVAEKKISISWSIYAQRIISSIQGHHVERMKKAGLQRITFGVESFSDKVRRDMGKVASDRVTDGILDLFLDKGIRVNLLMIYGYPTETEDDFQATWTRIAETGKRFHQITFNCFVPTNEYVQRRPGVVTFEKGIWSSHNWSSETLNLEVRRERFMRLAELLGRLHTDFKIGDPLMIRYYTRWNKRQATKAQKDWEHFFAGIE